MVSNHHFTRVDTLQLKDLIYWKIGQQRAELYFNQLKRFLSLKLSKVGFDKSCIRTIGRENIVLHNQLICSIVQNACLAKVPRKGEGSVGVKVGDGYQRTCMQSIYGDAFPPSPRTCRSPVNRYRKFRDRLSPLGPLGKSPSITCQEDQSANELQSLASRRLVDVALVEDGEEVEQFIFQSQRPITAPLGVCMNTGSSSKSFFHGFNCNAWPETFQNSGELPDAVSLRRRLEKKLEKEGFGISLDCVNLLNKSLDVYLKRLIEPCIGNAGSRCKIQQARPLIDQIRPGRHTQGPTRSTYLSMQDFRCAMELNPCVLREDWSIQLEKISSRTP